MSITKADKAALVEKHARSNGDSGSVEVQVAILTTRISNLTTHLKKHRKDISTTRGLVGMVAKRRKLLNYLKRTDTERYKALVGELKIRH